MEENKDTQETADNGGEDTGVSKEISDFNFLISTLIAYYQAKAGLRDDEGEEWKRETKYERMDIPKRVDDAVERSFLVQLKQFSDPNKTNAQW